MISTPEEKCLVSSHLNCSKLMSVLPGMGWKTVCHVRFFGAPFNYQLCTGT